VACIGHKRNKETAAESGGKAKPLGCLPAGGEGASKHVESLRREGPRLHAFQRTIDYSVPRNISIRFCCGVWAPSCLIITNR
jgi:hypothetical protein